MISISGNKATLVGGNVNSSTIGQQKVGTKEYSLDANNIILPEGVPTSDPIRQVYAHGSILRSKNINKITKGQRDKNLNLTIAEVAKLELDNWPGGKVEIDPECEDIVRKYIQGGVYSGIYFNPGGTLADIPRDASHLGIPSVYIDEEEYGPIPPKFTSSEGI